MLNHKKTLKRQLLAVAAFILAIVTPVLLIPISRGIVIGLICGENIHDWHPTSYWIAALRDENFDLRIEACEAIRELGPDAREAAPVLIEIMKETNESTPYHDKARVALLSIDPDAVVQVYAEGLRDERPEVRINAIWRLRRLGSAASIPILKKASREDPNPDVRANAAVAMYGIEIQRKEEPILTVSPRKE